MRMNVCSTAGYAESASWGFAWNSWRPNPFQLGVPPLTKSELYYADWRLHAFYPKQHCC